ncbi:MAG: ribonuclease J [Acholeplasmataceae bacterium]|nr:ribonuclease J [Acholeplasmataceae bacterium]
MKRIRFFALGGLGENGKNMYAVEVENEIFILDAGLKYPTNELYGVDEIIPDYKMLVRAKRRIVGIFISHAHEDHVGALPYMLKDLEVPVFGTPLALAFIKDSLVEAGYDLNDYTFVTVNPDQTLPFNNANVTFFNTTHSIPESVGIAIETEEGSVVYTSEFTFNQGSDERYWTNFKKINEIANRGVLALLIESVGSYHTGFKNIDILRSKIENYFLQARGRIIVSLFASDIQKIQWVINISLQHKKKIAVIGRKAQRIVDIALQNGYLDVPKDALINLRFIDDKHKNNQEDLVCIVIGKRHEPFYMLQRMAKKIDRLVHIESDDTIILLTPPIPGTETMAARTLDVLYRGDSKIKLVDRKLLSTSHASSEEVKMMINLFRPKYIIPVIGEYQHQVRVQKLATEIGYDLNDILVMDNGDVATFEKGKYIIGSQDIRTGDILIDGTPLEDNNDIILRDRELLAENGVILVIANVNAKTRQIIDDDIEVIAKGFTYHQEVGNLLEDLKDIFLEVSKKELIGRYIDWNNYKRNFRNEASRYIYQKIRRNPIIIPVIIGTDF